MGGWRKRIPYQATSLSGSLKKKNMAIKFTRSYLEMTFPLNLPTFPALARENALQSERPTAYSGNQVREGERVVVGK